MRFTALTKFKISETKIDNFNETNNQLYTFDEGINIICGDNEAGKSTLMDFVKNIFIRKSSSAKGYVKCEYEGESFNLIAGETKKLKENEKYIERITAHDFQTGFVINIDDLMFAKKANAEELLNTIKDSSGNAVNQKQEEYAAFIYDAKKQKFSLTNSNGLSTNFKRQFDDLKKMDEDIKKLQLKEESYNSVCQSITLLEEDLRLAAEKLEYAEILFQKNNALKEKENININKKVLEHKSEFDKLREEFGALNSLKRNEEAVTQKIENNKKNFDENFKKLNRLEDIKIEDFDGLNLENEDLKLGRKLIEEEKSFIFEQNNLQSKTDELAEQIDNLNNCISSSDERRNKLNIYDINEYKSDKDMLISCYTRFSDLKNRMSGENFNPKQKKWFEDMFIMLFVILGLGMLGSVFRFWHSSVKYVFISMLLVSIVGINTVIMQKLSAKKQSNQFSSDEELVQCEKTAIKLAKKYGYDIQPGVNFIVTANTVIEKMKSNIAEYENIDSELLRIRMDLERAKTKLAENEKLSDEITEKLEDLAKEKSKYLERIHLSSTENLEEIFELTKDLKFTLKTISESETDLQNLEKNIESFTDNLNKFIENTGLNDFQKYSKYDYPKFDEVLSKIDKIVCGNIANEQALSDIDSKIQKYDEKASVYPHYVFEKMDEETLNELKNIVKSKTEEKARLSQQKDDLEKVSGLYDLRNAKNVELNRIRLAISKLIQKEIIYNVIGIAKDKFNETQPNFVSAKEYFSKITGGKYSEIDFETKTISGDGIGDKDWDNLSRGTKEQLYLALRLGYAGNYSKDLKGNPNGKPDLPIIIDDAFVNFDKERTSAILKCLSEFAKTNQVLYFTCHSDSVKEILKNEKIKHNYIEL